VIAVSNKKKSYLDTMNDSTDILRDIAYQLLNKSDVLYIVGMESLAEDLKFISEDIHVQVKKINDMLSNKIHSYFEEAQKMSATILYTALTGIQIGNRGTK
jgi:hypothetical protein